MSETYDRERVARYQKLFAVLRARLALARDALDECSGWSDGITGEQFAATGYEIQIGRFRAGHNTNPEPQGTRVVLTKTEIEQILSGNDVPDALPEN